MPELRRPIPLALVAVLLAACVAAASAMTRREPEPSRQVVAPAPVVLITDPGDPFTRYYGEILRAEGLNAFDVAPVSRLDDALLARHAVVLLAARTPTAAQVAALGEWTQGGGDLVAMRPGAGLAPLLGLRARAGTLSNGYLTVDTASSPGKGITAEAMQFHGAADRWTVTDARAVARLGSGPAAAGGDPAVTLRSVGAAGGQAAAFTFDLARSVVHTRQGNPAWAGQDRDAALDHLVRSDDLFFGARAGDVQADWVNLDKAQIPQADEQQRLLANLLTTMSADRVPLPRFWYLPRGLKAAVVMTGDDHAGGGTARRFERMRTQGSPGCSLARWSCPRMTSYVFPGTPLTDAQVKAFQAEGFEIALHLDTRCADFSAASLPSNWAAQMPLLRSAWPDLAPPRTSRTHCVTWSDWATQPKVEARNGVRLDTTYYYWPGAWVRNRPGLFTGSGFPMRFADEDGSLIDVYQATTQLTDESGMDLALHIDTLLDNALGDKGYYGVFTANMHTDTPTHAGADTIVTSALARDVPVVPAVRILEWVDGRNDSAYESVSFTAGRLRFRVARAPGADGLQGMLPADGPTGRVRELRHGGVAVALTERVVKGVRYAVFDARSGTYTADYGPPAGSGAE